MTEIVSGGTSTQKTSNGGIQSLAIRTKPIVIKTGKKKRRYSRGLKGLQQRARKGNRAGSRLINAFADGFDFYRKKSDRSSRKKKDGMIKDFWKNSASGLGKTMRKSSKVPKEMVKVFKPRKAGRAIRAFSRALSPFR